MILQQTYAIWWKNLKVRRRHWILTSFEVTIPIICFIFVVLIRSKIDIFAKVYVNETYHDSVDDELIYSRLNIHDMKLYYAPKTDFTTDLIRRVQMKLNIYKEGIKGFSSEKELISFYDKHGDENVNAVVLFEDVGDNVPSKLKYDVKMYQQHILWKTDTLFQDFLPYVAESGSEAYLQKGFLPIQLALDTSFIELATEKDFDTLITFQEFPYPPRLQDNGINSFFLNLLPLITVFSFIVLCVSTLNRVMKEKSSGINALMKMHGLSSSTLWMGWLINGMVFYIIPVTGVVLLLKFCWGASHATIEYCDYLTLFLFLFLYCAASISSLLALTTMFDKPVISMAVGVILWIVSSVVFCGITYNVDVTFLSIKIGLLLTPNISLFYGYSAIANFEQREKELNFSNLFETPTGSSDDVTMGLILVMLVVDTIFYFIVTLYLDQIYPGPHGISKSWHFLFHKTESKPILKAKTESKQIPKAKTESTPILKAKNESTPILKAKNESTPILIGKTESKPILQIAVTMIELIMKFGDKTAVNIPILEIHKSKITALLGPNGAGKTTTMSILAGLLNPTSGTVLINDIELNAENVSEIQKQVTICPQEIILFADLTVSDQLIFFGMLRGLSIDHSRRHVDAILSEKLKLHDKANCYTDQLSGGMKKAVSLGISLIGDPKVLILDEPTAGIDIEGRAATWELVRSLRQSNTILVSTHLMEEADELSDRLALLNNGKVLCHDTTSFLKSINGIGHQLMVKEIPLNQVKQVEKLLVKVLDRNQPTDYAAKYILPSATRNSLKDVFERLKKENISVKQCSLPLNQRIVEKDDKEPHLKGESNDKRNDSFIIKCNSMEKMENVQSSLIMSSNDECTSTFYAKYHLINQHKKDLSEIFEELEKNKVTFTLANPTVQDLYIKVLGENEDAQEKEHFKATINDEPKRHKTNSGCSPGRAALIILKKRLLYFYKKWITYITMPVMMIFITMLVIYLCGDGIVHVNKDGRKLKLVLNAYGETGVFYVSHGSNNYLLSKTYSDVVSSQNGIPKNIDNMQQAIIQEGKDNIAYYHQRMVMGTEFQSVDDAIKNVTVMYSHNALHGVSISLNVVMNTLVKYMLGDEYSIVASNTPLHSVQKNVEQVEQSSTGNLIIWLTLFPLGPLFILSNAIMLVHVETSTLVKHLQYIAGVPRYIYWMVNYLCDFIYCSLPILLCALAFFTTEIYHPGTLIVILMLYVATAIPFSYFFTYSSQVENAYARFILSNVSIGTVLTFITLAIEIPSDDSFQRASEIVPYIFAINPQFTLNYMLAKYSNKMVANHNWNIKTPQEKANMCNHDQTHNPCCDGEISCAEFQSFFNDESFIYIWIVTIVAVFVAFIMLTLWNDCVGNIFNRFGKNGGTIDPVQAINVEKVTKQYIKDSGIKDLDFYVPKGKCFAILGPNGAGKSTTFRLLAKQEGFTHGKITTTSLPNDKYQKRGYCPQQDALIGEFTGRELLNIFAELRGIHRDTVTDLLEKFDLLKYADKPCAQYSGGNKRKLNVCISMIANPQIIILDEPTTGVDPISRKKMWNVIEELKADNSSIILSSHSMDECERFCDVLMVLNNGGMADIGTLGKLKEKYSSGFVIKLMLSNTDPACRGRVEESIKKNFDEPNIINSKHDLIYFHAKNSSWFEVLQKLEKLQEEHKLDDYDLNKSTLHDVFLKVIEKPLNH